MMTTSTSARNDAQGSPTWVLWLFGIALIVLFIWLWNTANVAKETAEANAALLARPEVELHYLAGGPSRFAEAFQESVEDAEIENFSSDEFLWATALISNEGIGELDDVTMTLDLAEGLHPTVITNLPSFGSGLDVEETESGLEVDLRDIDDGELAKVFVGFDPANLPDTVVDDWPGNYRTTIGSMTVETEAFSETLYGSGV